MVHAMRSPVAHGTGDHKAIVLEERARNHGIMESWHHG